jgi:hypothetical protein
MSELRIVVSCGDKRIETIYTDELVNDLKAIMGLDLYEELMNMILHDVKKSVMKVTVDNPDGII